MKRKIINYEFPENSSPTLRYVYGARKFSDACTLHPDDLNFKHFCKQCPWQADKAFNNVCRYYHVIESETMLYNITKSACKELLRKFGGKGWIIYFDRFGRMYKTKQLKRKVANIDVRSTLYD